MKQMRRGGRGYDTRGGFAMETPGFNNLPGFPALPPMDPNNPMASIMALQQMMGMPGMPQLPFAGSPQPGTAQPHRTGKRCRDYDTKGFCARGAACMYDHGNDHLVAPDTGAEYDPTNASLAQGENGMSERGRGYDGRGRGRGRGRGDRGAFRGGRGGRAEFSSAGPNHDRSITSVVVEQIPEEKFNEDSVREFFSEFGNIEEVTMQEYKRLAIIKYDDYSAAKRAYDSPKVIFENRFVKVYWYKPDSLPRPQGGHQNGEAARPVAEDVEMKEIETIDPVELAKKQEEAQRVHEEKKKQFEAAQAQRQELEEKMRQQAEERRKLVAKLAAKERTKSGTPDVGTQANGAANGTAPKDSSQTEALKAKLAALEKEAVSMGINPDEEAAAESWQGFPPRGRGGYRVRGAWQPRGAWRGRGRGGFVPRGGSVMRLDNRPKSIAVTFPDGDEMGPDKDEALKQYLLFVSSLSLQLSKIESRADIHPYRATSWNRRRSCHILTAKTRLSSSLRSATRLNNSLLRPGTFLTLARLSCLGSPVRKLEQFQPRLLALRWISWRLRMSSTRMAVKTLRWKTGKMVAGQKSITM